MTLLLSDAQRLDWLRLLRSENVGPRTFRMLIDRFGGARAALEALPDLARKGGLARPIRVCPASEAEREVAALDRLGVLLRATGETGYPPLLRTIDDAPPLLAIWGDPAVADRPAVAIVGSRNASAAGQRFATQLARDLGEAGHVVVSGLARGIDACAHRATLTTGTIAAIAGGLDRIYPPENVDLAMSIRDRGALVSEMPLGWEPRARDFPRRNRLISGISAGLVVVEATLRSGSLITARMAGEHGREVMAVPGFPLDPRAEGTNRLIRDGATLITGAADVLEALAPMLGPRQPSLPLGEEAPIDPGVPEDDLRTAITNLLGATPVPVDELVRLSGASPGLVQVVLLELDLAGRLTRNGGLVSLV